MTSQIRRDEVEQQIWMLLGSRRVETWKVDKLMRLIDTYAIVSARKFLPPMWQEPPLEKDIPADPWEDLAPGESDMHGGVCRCSGPCGKVKKLSNFTGTGGGYTRPSGGSTICRKCRARQAKRAAPVDGETGLKQYFCRHCKRRKDVGEFPPEKAQFPIRGIPCLICAEKIGWSADKVA